MVMLEVEEFILEMVMVLPTESYAQLGLLTTLLPTSVAHPVSNVGVMVLGNTILTIPDDVSASFSTIFSL